MWIVAIPAAVFAVITLFKPEWLFGLFSQDPEVLAMAITYIPIAMIQYLGCVLRPPNFALINGSGNSKLNLAVALLDGIFTRIGLSLLLGVTFRPGSLPDRHGLPAVRQVEADGCAEKRGNNGRAGLIF